MRDAHAVSGQPSLGRLVWTGLAFAGLYWGAPLLAWRDAVLLVPGPLAAAVPLLPSAIWIYLSEFAMVAVSLWRCDPRAGADLLDALTITIVAAASVFLLFPTEVPRSVHDFAGLTGLAWRALHALDTPKNALPSLHAAVAVPCVVALWRRGGTWRVIGPSWGLAVALSALATRQHFVPDLFAGLALGVVAQILVARRGRRSGPVPFG